MEIFTQAEDNRHSVSKRVLQHYKSLKSGGDAPSSTDADDESGRKSLEGDWLLSISDYVLLIQSYLL